MDTSIVVYNSFYKLARNLIVRANQVAGGERLIPYRLNGKNYWELKSVGLPKRDVHFNKYNWRKDIFITYPPLESVTNAPENYKEMRTIFQSTKSEQRVLLHQIGINVPPVYDETLPEKFIVRSSRHFGGANMWKIDGRQNAVRKQLELGKGSYISQVVPFEKEFRVIFVNGIPTIVLLKKDENGYFAEDGFPKGNHLESRFITVNKKVNNKLLKTSFYEDVKSMFELFPFQIVAMDIGFQATKFDNEGKTIEGRYWVFEMNFAPEVSITESLDKILTERGIA